MKSLLITCITIMSISCALKAQVLVSDAFQQNQLFSPLMEVNIEATCQHSDLYKISYSNHGSAIATDAYVVISITNEDVIETSSIPPSSIEGNDYTFDIGDVLVGQSGFFTIELPASNHQTRCVQVHIYPDNPNQATINQYMTSLGGLSISGDINTGSGNGINTVLTASEVTSVRTVANTTTASGATGSIYEDHVILNVSGGDSINDDSGNTDLLITGNGNNTVNNSQDQGNRTNENGDLEIIDINALFSAEHCKQANNTTSNNTTILGTKELASFSTINNTSDDISTNNDKTTISANVYPNPFNDQAAIELEGAYNQNLQLSILDITGKVVHIQNTEKQSKIIINRSNLNQGVYVYHIANDEKLLHTGKIIVQ